MYREAVLVHGYWISKGVDELARKQAYVAGKTYKAKKGRLILCPTGNAEWGQGSIGKFIKNRILKLYKEIPSQDIVVFNNPSIVSTKGELLSSLRYLQKTGIKNIIDVCVPSHFLRVQWLFQAILSQKEFKNSNFQITYKKTTDYLTKKEKEELYQSPIYISFTKSEKLRYLLTKNKLTSFAIDTLLPYQLKAQLEAFQVAHIK